MTTISPIPIPPLWTNQQVTLYHGTIQAFLPSILAGIDLDHGRTHTDFGQGFYTTTWLRQAQTRAWQLAENRKSPPVVVRFDVDREVLATLDSLWFVCGSFTADDFWSLVYHCRSGHPDHGRASNNGWYDLVVGPVVASWKQRLVFAESDQISFHTSRAGQLLDSSAHHRHHGLGSLARGSRQLHPSA